MSFRANAWLICQDQYGNKYITKINYSYSPLGSLDLDWLRGNENIEQTLRYACLNIAFLDTYVATADCRGCVSCRSCKILSTAAENLIRVKHLYHTVSKAAREAGAHLAPQLVQSSGSHSVQLALQGQLDVEQEVYCFLQLQPTRWIMHCGPQRHSLWQYWRLSKHSHFTAMLSHAPEWLQGGTLGS